MACCDWAIDAKDSEYVNSCGYLGYRHPDYNKSGSGFEKYQGSYYPSANAPEKAQSASAKPRVLGLIDKTEWKAAKDGRGVDCTLISGDLSLQVHKLKLMLNSQFFNDFLPNYTPKSSIHCDIVEQLKDIDPRILKTIVKFMYVRSIGAKSQKDITDGRLDLLAILKTAHRLGVDSIIELGASLFDLQSKNKISAQYEEWFAFACHTNSSLLFGKILGMDKSYEQKLVGAINSASRNLYITKEIWALIKSKGFHADILRQCEQYNPYISQF